LRCPFVVLPTPFDDIVDTILADVDKSNVFDFAFCDDSSILAMDDGHSVAADISSTHAKKLAGSDYLKHGLERNREGLIITKASIDLGTALQMHT